MEAEMGVVAWYAMTNGNLDECARRLRAKLKAALGDGADVAKIRQSLGLVQEAKSKI